MHIRAATLDDVDQLIGLVSDFYFEAPYDAPLVNADKTRSVMTALVSAQEGSNHDVFVHVLDNKGLLQGMIVAERIEDLWSDALIVLEYFIYVAAGARGSLGAGRLLLRFKQWTEEKPSVVRTQASSGIDDDGVVKLYEKMGWKPRGQIYGTEAY